MTVYKNINETFFQANLLQFVAKLKIWITAFKFNECHGNVVVEEAEKSIFVGFLMNV